MEVEFTYGVRLGADAARAVGRMARRKGIVLSVHAPYYINLASQEPDKLAASKQRILDSCHRADLMGAQNVVFHAGFYQNRTPQETFDHIATAVDQLQREIKRNGWRVKLCPEVTGKASQFGSLDELLHLKKAVGCSLCVDFAHLYAREQGKVDWPRLLARAPKRFHAHFSGIAFGPRGEEKHLNAAPGLFRPLAEALLERGAGVTLICESPHPYEDALMMQRMVGRLKCPSPGKTARSGNQ